MQRIAARHVLSLLPSIAFATSAHGAEPIPQGERVVYESLGGLGGAVVGGLVGYGIGMATIGDGGEYGPLFALVFAAFPGAILGMPTGVYVTGEACGGDGNYWATLGGALLGAAVPTAVSFALGDDDNGLWPLGLALWITMPTAGAVIGYELSQRDSGAPGQGVGLQFSPLPGGFYAGYGTSF